MARRTLFSLLLLPAAASVAHAEARLAPIFQSGMVLQQGNATRVYGTASPNEKVTVMVGSARASGKAGADGHFDLKLKTPPAGGPYTVEVAGENGAPQRLNDVLVGEVWFCSGQSNMEWEESWFNGRRFDVGDTNLPNVRLFKHAHRIAGTPQKDALGTWAHVDATNAHQFTLVGFLFGRRLNKELNVPVGLIESAWGGTPAESWIDIGSLDARPELATQARKYRAAVSPSGDAQAEYRAKVQEWNRKTFGDASDRPAWASETIDASAWKSYEFPNAIEQIGLPIDGVVWIRRTVDVPADLAGKDLTLELGPIDDYDSTYVNGERVGWTGPDTPNAYAALRQYTVPSRLVKAGANTIAIRIIDTGGGGGPNGKPEQMRLGSGSTWLPLAGSWLLRIEDDYAKSGNLAKFAPPEAPLGLDNPWLPTGLYNGMVTSVAPYSVRGAIWYQGESNAGRAAEYSVLFPEMIKSWRRTWQDPKMAFHFVQLASFGAEGDSTSESSWAELRESQTAALKLPGVGMAVAVDAGEALDIHPIRKDLVADRLALAALGRTYGKRVEFEGPTPRSVRADGGALRIRMAHGKGMKTLDGAPPRGFAVAGVDGKYYVADVRIEGEEIVLSSSKVARPVYARYAWADYIAANLANGSNLPAPPFRVAVSGKAK